MIFYLDNRINRRPARADFWGTIVLRKLNRTRPLIALNKATWRMQPCRGGGLGMGFDQLARRINRRSASADFGRTTRAASCNPTPYRFLRMKKYGYAK